MIEAFDNLDLEAEPLEEVSPAQPAAAPTAPPSAAAAQPVVVIEYRTRGVPWYVVLILLLVVTLGAVAFYHRATSRAWRNLPYPRADLATRKEADKPAVTNGPAGAPAGAAREIGAPLALNSLPIPAGSIADVAHPTAPAPKTTAPTTTPPPSAPAPGPPKTGATTDPSKAVSSNPAQGTPAPAPDSSTPKPGATQLASATPVTPDSVLPRKPIAVGFSVPNADESPFADLDVSRGRPGSMAEGQAASDRQSSDFPTDPAPTEKPAPTEEQMRQDLEAEAAEKRATLNQQRELKNRAREVLDDEAQTRVEDERAAFRRDLRDAIKLPVREASEQIENLCTRYGRNYSDELRKKVKTYFFRNGGKLSPEGKVRVLRLFGVPEAVILDFLANEIDHRILKTRNGPKDEHEVRVDAAKQLLRIGLKKDAAGGSPELQAQRVRPTGPAAPSFAPGNPQVR